MKQRARAERDITGFGRQVPVTRMPFDEAMALLGKDLRVARERSAAGDRPSYFDGKARLIQECIKEHEGRRSEESGTGLLVGYGPGRKYLYQGLPVEIAINVDRAVIEVIDLIARCRHVVMTGACCAGHPSKQIRNPYPGNSSLAGEDRIYTQNVSPHFNIMLPVDDAGASIVEMLSGVRTETAFMGMSVGIAAEIDGTGRMCGDSVMMLPMMGVPTLHCARAAPDYPEVATLYRRALADFWRAVKDVFQMAAREQADDPKPDDFACKRRVDAEAECALIAERRQRGMTRPNYLYFNGTTSVVKPRAG